MERFSYDLHVHSCLSPCGDDEATPNSIAGMAKVIGLDLLALTDHNSAGNCPAFFKAAERYGITPVAGMELTTSEDIHLLCLFPTLENAMDFDAAVQKRHIQIPNKPSIFGSQRLMDENDEIIGEEDNLLINATTLTLEEGAALCRSFSGAALPAHIDRESNGIIAVLGAFPDEPDFPAIELHDGEKLSSLSEQFPALKSKRRLISSDAHDILSLSEPVNFLSLEAIHGDDEGVRRALIEYLRAEGGL